MSRRFRVLPRCGVDKIGRAVAARRAAALAVFATLLASTAAAVRAEIVQQGNLRVTTSGKLSPSRLPRHGAAPIAVTVGGRIATADGTLPPQLRSMRIELNRHGRLETAGLPDCARARGWGVWKGIR